MNELIPINQHEGRQAVSARDLHSFLESRQDFSTWMKSRIEKYGLIEDTDFTLHKIVERGKTGAQTKIEYILALDTAKELAMVEGNEKGRQARRYFIACEKKLKELHETGVLETRDNTAALLDMMDAICQVKEHSIRETLRQQVLALKGESIQIQEESKLKSEYTDVCRIIIRQACETYYLYYMPTFMNHKGLAIAAAIMNLALDYIKLHNIPLFGRYNRNRFYNDLSHETDMHDIKYIPKDGRNLRNKLRLYDKGAFITDLVKLKNVGNQNAKRL